MTNTNNTRLAAANLLLDRGVKYSIPNAPLFLQLLQLNKIEIRPLKAGTLIEISRIIDENKLNEIETTEQANQKLEPIIQTIAVAILNSKRKILYFSNTLSNILLWKIPLKILLAIFYHIMQVNNIMDFMNITKYFEHHVQMMMGPKNLGQEVKGSQQAIQMVFIALLDLQDKLKKSEDIHLNIFCGANLGSTI